EAGCVVVRGEEVHAIPAYPVSKVVDVTGAGDLFAAGFLLGLTHGLKLAHCAQLGALAAAEVISHIGARPEVNLRAHARAVGLL
ncbi:MAG: PfkB family carbohydrate kinase, partial [Alphaproteobacteria bacterium]|nr:PfkB family carbohydrate kinase [Alphaproteobacteria bacterium]